MHGRPNAMGGLTYAQYFDGRFKFVPAKQLNKAECAQKAVYKGCTQYAWCQQLQRCSVHMGLRVKRGPTRWDIRVYMLAAMASDFLSSEQPTA